MTKLGRFLFAIAIAAFGIEYLIYGRFVPGLPPAPPWTPGAPVLAYLIGVALTVAGLGIATNVRARLCAAVVGVLFFLCVFLLHGLRAEAILLNPVARTGAFESLAFGSAAFISAALLPSERSSPAGWEIAIDRLALASRYLFAFSMIVFGIQHYRAIDFIASLVPAWLPGHVFWAYLTGTGFIAAGIAIAINVRARLGATLLGVMFLLWVLLLHLPRSVAAWSNGAEWTSLFVALGLSGGAWIVAGYCGER